MIDYAKELRQEFIRADIRRQQKLADSKRLLGERWILHKANEVQKIQRRA